MSWPLGDPGSTGELAGTLLRRGRELEERASLLEEAVSAAAEGWGGPGSVRQRRAVDSVVATIRAAAAQMHELGRSMHDHAADLADAVGELRRIDEAARDAGLALRDGRVVEAPGIRGVADPGAVDAMESTRRELDARLGTVLTLADRRRARLRATCEASRKTLAEAGRTLR